LHEIGDVPKSPVPVLTALVHVSEDKSDMRGIKAGWSPSWPCSRSPSISRNGSVRWTRSGRRI